MSALLAQYAALLHETPCRICVDPTDISADYPHGGADIGKVDGVQLHHVSADMVYTPEGTGISPSSVLHGGRAYSIGFVLREWTTAGLTLLLPGILAGAVTRRPLWAEPSKTAGTWHTPRAVYASPINAREHPGCYLYAAAPLIDESIQIAMRHGTGWGIPCVMVAEMNDDGRVLDLGMVEDIAARADL